MTRNKYMCTFPFKDAVLIWNHDKGCNFVVPPNTELWVLAHEFYKIKPKDDPNYNPLPCAQHIQVNNTTNFYYSNTMNNEID